jgi:serine/threonine-protein kinase HipA
VSTHLIVLLAGVPIGNLSRHQGAVVLTYDRDWQASDDRIPLSLSLPAVKQVHRTPAVNHFFDALFPDDLAVRTRWGRDFEVDGNDILALLSVVGGDLPGAVQVIPEGMSSTKEGLITWLSDNELADILRGLRADATSWVPDIELGAFSLAGAQRKTALVYRDGRWGRATGATPTTHILKTGVSGHDAQAEVEHLSLRLAHHLGFSVANSTLILIEDQVAVAIERFDRERIGSTIRRLHQEDGCQALGRDPRKRYHSEGGPSAADWTRLLWRNTATPEGNAKAFASALVLQWLIGGTDAHARNYSVQHLSTGSRFAPLYDLASVVPYLPPERSPKLAMAIGGETQVDRIGPDELIAESKSCGLPRGWLLMRAEELLEGLPTAIDATAAGNAVLPAATEMTNRWAQSLHKYATERARQLRRHA